MKPHPPGDDEGALSVHPCHRHPMRDATIVVTLLVRSAAVLTTSLGVIILAGWALGPSLFKSVLPGAMDMKVNTAVGLVLAGCALFILDDRPSPPLQRSARRGDKEGKH